MQTRFFIDYLRMGAFAPMLQPITQKVIIFGYLQPGKNMLLKYARQHVLSSPSVWNRVDAFAFWVSIDPNGPFST
jgi:hypothetical protein